MKKEKVILIGSISALVLLGVTAFIKVNSQEDYSVLTEKHLNHLMMENSLLVERVLYICELNRKAVRKNGGKDPYKSIKACARYEVKQVKLSNKMLEARDRQDAKSVVNLVEASTKLTIKINDLLDKTREERQASRAS